MKKATELQYGKILIILLMFSLSIAHGESAFTEEINAVIISTNVICKEPGKYIGWPSIVKTSRGEIIVVFSGDRDAHICPWGKTEMVRSRDSGRYWSRPVIVNNTPLDDRDAGIIETKEGTLLVSWFTSLAFEQYGGDPRYYRHGEKLSPDVRKRWLGDRSCIDRRD